MTRLLFILVVVALLFSVRSRADGAGAPDNVFAYTTSNLLVFPSGKQKVSAMDEKLLKFISDTLYLGKPALNLRCDVKVREITEERKFSDGPRRVQMLEVIFKTSYFNLPEEKMYFPIGSQVTREIKVSKFAGTVEEIQLQSDDLPDSRFVFQHNGRGEIVWMTYEDDQKTAPCAVNK